MTFLQVPDSATRWSMTKQGTWSSFLGDLVRTECRRAIPGYGMASLGGLLQLLGHRRESGLQLHMILIDVS